MFLNSLKNSNNSLICFISRSVCALLFCNNLLTKFTAWVQAVMIPALRPEGELIIVQIDKDRLWGQTGQRAFHCWAWCRLLTKPLLSPVLLLPLLSLFPLPTWAHIPACRPLRPCAPQTARDCSACLLQALPVPCPWI